MKIKNSKTVISIDGFTASGKSSLAEKIRQRLGYEHINSGRLYRLVAALWAINKEKDPTNIAKDITIQQIMTENTPDLDSQAVNDNILSISSNNEIRKIINYKQKEFVDSSTTPGVVVEGRDIAINVIPYADLKILTFADILTRIKRYHTRTQKSIPDFSKKKAEHDINERDKRDSKHINMLLKIPNVHIIDTTHEDISIAVGKILHFLQKLKICDTHQK